jgi:hypothetical protein
MTKKVRIENADLSPYSVTVEVWDRGIEGSPDTLAYSRKLDFPTAMADDLYIHSGRFLVVREG